MKKKRRIAAAIWLFLIAQTIFVLRYPEPYPCFALPGFGLNENREETSNALEKMGTIQTEKKELAFIDEKNKMVLINSESIVGNISNYHKKYLFNKLDGRNSNKLNKSDYFYLKYNLYRSLFEAKPTHVNEIKNLISIDYKTAPKALLLVHYVDSEISKIDSLEIFE